MANIAPVVNIYPLSNYTYNNYKQPKIEYSVVNHFARMKLKYSVVGMRTSVEAILLAQEHNTPHVIFLLLENGYWKLPGGLLNQGENEIEGLRRKLSSRLAPRPPALQPVWQIGECVAKWWRPNFDSYMYPYCPPHVTRPKECKKIYIVQLSEIEYFEVPRNMELRAVPLFDLYDNNNKFGHAFSAIPEQLSRFQLRMISP